MVASMFVEGSVTGVNARGPITFAFSTTYQCSGVSTPVVLSTRIDDGPSHFTSSPFALGVTDLICGSGRNPTTPRKGIAASQSCGPQTAKVLSPLDPQLFL